MLEDQNNDTEKLHFESPRIRLDDEHILPTSQQLAVLRQPEERWKHIREQASSHQQDRTHVLDLTDRSLVHPHVLRCGLVKSLAKQVTEVYLGLSNSFFLKHMTEWMDVMAPVFTDLKHLYISHCNKEEKSKKRNSYDSNTTSSMDERKPPHKLHPSVRYQRHYIVYRIPTLRTIDGQPVTVAEREASHLVDTLFEGLSFYHWLSASQLLDEQLPTDWLVYSFIPAVEISSDEKYDLYRRSSSFGETDAALGAATHENGTRPCATDAFLYAMIKRKITREPSTPVRPMTHLDFLYDMHQNMIEFTLEQLGDEDDEEAEIVPPAIPRLTSSRWIDLDDQMELFPGDDDDLFMLELGRKKKRAILIGINYCGIEGELTTSWKGVQYMKKYLMNAHHFREEDMLILMDDGYNYEPTKINILNAFRVITQRSQPGDDVFIHFIGHGGHTFDLDGDEDDDWIETLIPVDFEESGDIPYRELYLTLLKPMHPGVNCRALIDCSNHGTILKLPYQFTLGEPSLSIDAQLGQPPEYHDLSERIKYNDNTLVELILADPKPFMDIDFDKKLTKLCEDLAWNFCIERVYLQDGFLNGYTPHERSRLLLAIGQLPRMTALHIVGVDGLTFRQLENAVVRAPSLQELIMSGCLFLNDSADCDEFAQLLQEHPRVKKYKFNNCSFDEKAHGRTSEDHEPYIRKSQRRDSRSSTQSY